ncbi:MAG TPA: DUF2442 domain-containing protein [Rhizomicrobium sp.]|nr:DUF2442 domain-containing protein [Rhizomicrobium sp.]
MRSYKVSKPVKRFRIKPKSEVFDAEIDAALARGKAKNETEPRAQSVRFDRDVRKIVVTFTNGSEFSFPPELAQGLSGATDEQLGAIRILGKGHGLHWEALDTDLTVPGLVDQVFGTRKFMAQQAGKAKSAAKAAAARENGAKGGRPRKEAHVS